MLKLDSASVLEWIKAIQDALDRITVLEEIVAELKIQVADSTS